MITNPIFSPTMLQQPVFMPTGWPMQDYLATFRNLIIQLIAHD
jgi:hypothetical protein